MKSTNRPPTSHSVYLSQTRNLSIQRTNRLYTRYQFEHPRPSFPPILQMSKPSHVTSSTSQCNLIDVSRSNQQPLTSATQRPPTPQSHCYVVIAPGSFESRASAQDYPRIPISRLSLARSRPVKSGAATMEDLSRLQLKERCAIARPILQRFSAGCDVHAQSPEPLKRTKDPPWGPAPESVSNPSGI
jgi:hypothetical protein